MNTALRVVRPRMPPSTWATKLAAARPHLERGLSEPSFKIADLGNNFPRHTQRSEKSSRNDNSPVFGESGRR
jgi:hypothetical protein